MPRSALVLGHGAGGGVESPDLVGATQAANEAALSVALVEQPYRVAGRRSPAPAPQLDKAWLAVDPVGIRPPGPNREVVPIPGTHSLTSGSTVASAVSDWLTRLLPIFA